MRSWKSALSVFLLAAVVAGCGTRASAPRLDIAAARIERRGDGVWLSAGCTWRPSAAMLDALDHGIALTLRLRLVAEAPARLGWHADIHASERRVELRYFPLTRQYQWRDLDQGTLRSFDVRASALAAIERLELPLPGWSDVGAERYRLAVDLDTDALPGALRLPALVREGWRQSRAELTWPARAG